ncbi:MAG TPA: hypothetical protein VFW33_00505 [Gemmataceae bacterium]|nr:hypothetical protein [Gemmataceae bacterium]
MGWPLSQDYNEAVQNPAVNCADPDLRRGRVATNALGLPLPCSGNFADVYQLRGPDGTRWAVKCFTREVPGRARRYEAISAHLRRAKLPFTVDFTYLEKGILVAGRWYPVLKMEWVEGLTLNQFVSRAADKPATLETLLPIWARMGAYLRGAQVAHADLQHGNVLLVPGGAGKSLSLKLVDYDGMWVPALAGSKSGEVGHPAYQHPRRVREEAYCREVDRFPLLLVATALRALKTDGRDLWERYNNGDNLLFTEADLQAPTKSRLFLDLLRSTDPLTAELARQTIEALRGGLESAQLLDALMPGAPGPPKSTSVRVANPPPPRREGPEAPAPPVIDKPIIRLPESVRRGRRGVKWRLAWAAGLAALALVTATTVVVVTQSNTAGPKPVAPPHPQPPLTLTPEALKSELDKQSPLFQDRFKDPEPAWPRAGDKDGAKLEFAADEFRIKAPKGVYTACEPKDLTRDDIACEVSGRVNQPRGAGWGVLLGREQPLWVALMGEKDVSVGYRRKDSQGNVRDVPWGKPVRHDAIEPVNRAYNTLLVVVRERQHVEVYANDHLVLKPFDVPPPFAPDSVALYVRPVDKEAQAEFRRIIVRSAEGLPPAPDVKGLAAVSPPKDAD